MIIKMDRNEWTDVWEHRQGKLMVLWFGSQVRKQNCQGQMMFALKEKAGVCEQVLS